METPREYYYTYYSYEEYGRGYFGSRGCKCLPKEDVKYFGSSRDRTFRPTQKIILKDDYLTREEAYADEIILHDYYDVANNPHFANRAKATSTGFYTSGEDAIKNGKKAGKIGGKVGGKIGGKIVGKKTKELGIGIFALTPEQLSENGKIGGKIGGKKAKELGLGVHGRTKEQIIKDSKKGAQRCKELGVGFFALTSQQKSENGRKGGIKVAERHKKNGTGIYGQTKEQKSEAGKIGGSNTSSQRWKCTETGFITTPGPLSTYQRARGIDISQRVRVQ
jgi:hypothetical protein